MAKIWKKLLLAILILACLFNIVTKLVKRYSLKNELQSTVQYMEEKKENNIE
jgi:Na+/alanine symporter